MESFENFKLFETCRTLINMALKMIYRVFLKTDDLVLQVIKKHKLFQLGEPPQILNHIFDLKLCDLQSSLQY